MGILDTNGLRKLWEHILQALEIKVDKELNKTLTTNDYTDEEKDKVNYAYTQVKDIQENIALALYPIGSIYININDVNPSTLFGGTWERIKDMFLLSSGDIFAVGEQGGEATHTLSIDEMPEHTHSYFRAKLTNNETAVSAGNTFPGLNFSTTPAYIATSEPQGATQPHNNMPPYLAVCVYKRIA